ncbi:hypothetical protein HDU91_002130 [Kappamyces sp. JEL0680]|nr:hypothetical protein HDU91_002130 [Kappamyces sp. JEL0680]
MSEVHELVVVGSGGVGKSCLTVRFLKDEFTNEYDPTIEENYRKNLTVDGSGCTAYIIDTAGQHEYKALRDQHLKDGKGFLLVFALNDKSSLEEVKQVREQIMKLKETRKVPFVICANKCDLPQDQREVDLAGVKSFFAEFKIPVLETSAKENTNVAESFEDLNLVSHFDQNMSTILTIREILPNHLGQKVRLYGKITAHEMDRNRFRLSHQNHSLWVDCALLPPFSPSKTCLWMVLGELVLDPTLSNTPMVRATILRKTEELDLRLLEALLEQRRKATALGETSSSSVFCQQEMAAKEESLKEEPQESGRSGIQTQPTDGHYQAGAGFQTVSTTDGGRDARIALRKARIEAARVSRFRPFENEDHQTRRTKKVEVESRDTSKAKNQIHLSSKRIENVRDTGNETVTNIRAGITARESIRRSEEAQKVGLWRESELQEITASNEAQSKIDASWDRVEKLSGPYELHELLQTQKAACDELLTIKDNLISEYVAELKLQDDEYVRELKRQTEEIDKLLDRMDVQFKNHQVALMEEAEQIERAFVEERTELITANARETDKLFETRKSNEAHYMEERGERIEDYIKQLEQLRVNDSEEYNLVKIKLETDVQVLEQQLQQMRVTYQLNTEKLEYNYQVLKKREEENGTILGAQKRKINRLADHLNLLKIKSAKQDKIFQQENTSLTDDYKHLTEQYKELQKKFRHFQLADSKRFKDIWKMNEEEAKEIMRKVLQADKIIYEQQLGLKWEPPAEDLFRNIDPLFFHTASVNGPQNLKEAEAAFENSMSAKPGGELDAKDSLLAKFQEYKGQSKTMKKTLELLCNEAGFLVEDKLQKLLAPLHKDEQSLMRLDSIFKALGVETLDDIERLTSYFVKEEDSTNIQNRAKMINEDKAVLIHPNDVVKALRKFVDTSRTMVKKLDVAASQAAEREGQIIEENEEDLAHLAQDYNEEAEVVLQTTKTQNLQKDYWNRMANVINDKSYRTWTVGPRGSLQAVYKGMEKYHLLLTQRWQTSQKIASMEQQNAELKSLLRQYMGARINDELQVPPTQIMLAQAGVLQE